MVPPDIDVVADLAADFRLEVGHQLADEPGLRPRDGLIVTVRIADEHIVATPWDCGHDRPHWFAGRRRTDA